MSTSTGSPGAQGAHSKMQAVLPVWGPRTPNWLLGFLSYAGVFLGAVDLKCGWKHKIKRLFHCTRKQLPWQPLDTSWEGLRALPGWAVAEVSRVCKWLREGARQVSACKQAGTRKMLGWVVRSYNPSRGKSCCWGGYLNIRRHCLYRG